MKQFIRSLLLSLLLTGVIGCAFWMFRQGTFFDPVVNRITMACLILLLAVVWYLFFSNLWFHHMQRKQRVLDALPQHPPTGEPEPEKEEAQPEEPANGPEATVFIPPRPEPQPEANPEPKPEAAPQSWTAAPESAQRPAAKPSRAASSRKTAEEKAAEKARKLQQAAQEKQARRARKLAEDAARQQQKLEDLRAEAARKKAAAPKKRMDWKNGEQQ